MENTNETARTLSFTHDLEEIVSGIFLSVTVIVVILNVILRYGFNISLFWVEEVATSCFVWSVFVGVAAAYKHKMHIGIDMIVNMFPAKIQQVIGMLIDFIMVVINGYIFYLSIIFTKASAIKTTPVLGVSSSWISGSIMVGFGLVTIYAFLHFIHSIKNVTSPIEKGGAV